MNNQVLERSRRQTRDRTHGTDRKTRAYERDRHSEPECCPEIPELRRLQYFYGQLLTSGDLQEEQRYFREKLRLLNRCVHGYGVLCGLRVVPVPDDRPCEPGTERERETLERELEERSRTVEDLETRLEAATSPEERQRLEEELQKARGEREEVERRLDELCPPAKEGAPSARVAIECGIAIDCHGNEIVVRRAKTIDLYAYLDRESQQRLRDDRKRPLWVSLCYCESPVEPVRPIHSDPCEPAESCRYAKIQESFRLTVSLDAPDADERCEPCCCTCAEPCLLLARIDPFSPKRPVPAAAIHNEVRRRFGLYDWVTVTGISWVHGGDYSADDAATLLGWQKSSDGLEFRFSRSVRADTLRRGVIDVTVVEGGRGRAGDIYNLPGRIHCPDGELVDRVFFRQTSDDKFHHGDLLRIRLRADFVLDACCRPVDGNHVGGRVPLLPGGVQVEHPDRHRDGCDEPPDASHWTSGNGQGGGLFESWIAIREPHPRDEYQEPGGEHNDRYDKGERK